MEMVLTFQGVHAQAQPQDTEPVELLNNEVINRVYKVTCLVIAETLGIENTFSIYLCPPEGYGVQHALFYKCPIKSNTTVIIDDMGWLLDLGKTLVVEVGQGKSLSFAIFGETYDDAELM